MSALSLDTSLIWTAQDIFNYPTLENMATHREEIQKLLAWAIDEGLPNSDTWIELLESEDFDLEQLEVDFTALFINGFPLTKAHPFAGWYTGEAIVFGPSDSKLRQFYSRYGVNLDQDQDVPADHIMVELEFLAIMAEKYEQTGEKLYYLALQEMMTGYLENWVFKFLDEMEIHAQSPYYRGLAAVLVLLFTKLKTELKEVA